MISALGFGIEVTLIATFLAAACGDGSSGAGGVIGTGGSTGAGGSPSDGPISISNLFFARGRTLPKRIETVLGVSEPSDGAGFVGGSWACGGA
jgi:hypothetical protein